MREKPQKLKSEDIYNEIMDSLVENELNEYPNPKEYFEAQGVNLDKLVQSGLDIVNKITNKARLKKRGLQLEAVRRKFQAFKSKLRTNPQINAKEALVDALVGENREMASVYYHKLDTISESDLREIVKDQGKLESLIGIFDELEEPSKE